MPIRVCVLVSSYEDSNSDLKSFEGHLIQSPHHYFSPDDPDFTFRVEPIKKATSYRQIRALVKSNEFDVFFNQCDGAKDEDRAGEDVIHALEEFHVPFTGSPSHCYEASKPDMKCAAYYTKIRSAPFAVVESTSDIARECAHLKFPVIVKHICGYSSVGMTRDCKCSTMEDLVDRAKRFMKEYQFAMVEEFITGDEVTVLACADSSQRDGVRVYHPVQVNFPDGEEFKHFSLKWEGFEGMAWLPVREDDPALEQMIDICRSSFKVMLSGVGYGRVDLRINRNTNEVFFLEINANCGIMYPPGQEGSADWILKLSTNAPSSALVPSPGHREFAILQIQEAIMRSERLKPVFRSCFDTTRSFHLRAVKDLPTGTVIFKDEGRAFRLHTKPFVESTWTPQQLEEFRSNAWPIGSEGHYFAIWDHSPACWRNFNHSCSPNMDFGDNRSLNVVAIRDIRAGDELTMDYRMFVDETMPPFQCFCGSPACEGLITPKQPRQTPVKHQLQSKEGLALAGTPVVLTEHM
jgi:D-alanine-D-alanine ligase-like ATP-grasp enzyme